MKDLKQSQGGQIWGRIDVNKLVSMVGQVWNGLDLTLSGGSYCLVSKAREDWDYCWIGCGGMGRSLLEASIKGRG